MIRIFKFTTLFVMTLSLVIAGASGAGAAVVNKTGAFYKIKVETSGQGESMVAKITVTGIKGYHCNMLYPWKLTLEPTEGISADHMKFKAGPKEKKDATHYGEDSIVFTVPYKASATAKTVNATLKLSLCDDKQCQMEAVNLSWSAR